MEHSPHERDRHRVEAHALAGDTAVGGVDPRAGGKNYGAAATKKRLNVAAARAVAAQSILISP